MLFASLRRWVRGSKPSRSPRQSPLTFAPQLTLLEGRALPSAKPALPIGDPVSLEAIVAPAETAASAHDGTSKDAKHAKTVSVPFALLGAGPAPQGLPLFPGGLGPHSSTGYATYLGRYTGSGTFQLGTLNISATGKVTGTFQGTFVFVGANGARLATTYGDGFTGKLTGQLSADGTMVTGVTFDAIFTPDPAQSTGQFANVVGGGFRMIAKAEAISLASTVPGYTAPFDYAWVGAGTLEFRTGKK